MHESKLMCGVERLPDLSHDLRGALGLQLSFCATMLRRSEPSTSRIATNSCSSASPASKTGITLGWSIEAARRGSRLKRSRNPSSSPSSSAISFSATCLSRAI